MMQNTSVSAKKVEYKDGSQNQTQSQFYRPMKPMNIKMSIAFFGIPALLMALSYYFLIPFFESLGISSYNSFFAGHILFMSLLLVASVVALHLEGINDFQGFKVRTRYTNFQKRYFVYALIAFVAMSMGYGFLDAITDSLIVAGIITIPSFVPLLGNPTIILDLATLTNLVGSPLKNNYGIIVIFLVSLIFNIVGEELWWRGYVLPRQEAQYGNKTWIIHGIFWTFFHSFKYWDLLGLLPVCLIISYIAQKQKNNYTAFLAHLIFNGLMIFYLLPLVL